MEVPKLELHYQEPKYRIAASYYDLKALVEWAKEVSNYLRDLAATLETEFPNELGGRLS